MLEIERLSVTYPDTRTPALRDIDLSMGNEKMVVVGANGSGKTTLLKAVLGLVPIASGRVTVLGREVGTVRAETGVSTNLDEVYRLISLPVRDLIPIYALMKGGLADELARRLHAFELDEVRDKRTYQLSTGQRKMVGNLFAVSFSPKLVLLDEPFDNVDFTRRRRFVQLLRELPATILVNTHELDLLHFFSGWNLGLMFDGRFFGPFPVADLDRLFLSRGRIAGARAVVETGLGTFSLTLDRGDTPVKSATSLNALVESLA